MKCIRLTEREIPLLEFIWKWRRAPWFLLADRFYPTCSQKTAYNRLNELRNARFLDLKITLIGGLHYYGLGKAGLEFMRTRLPLVNVPVRESIAVESEILMTAFQLGDWALQLPESVSPVSHRELRQLETKWLPTWVPPLPSFTSSGLTHFEMGVRSVTFAIEVESMPLSNAVASKKLEAYSQIPSINRVLWLAPSLFAIEQMDRLLPLGENKCGICHSFSWADDFKIRGWDCEILGGSDRGKTIHELYSEVLPDSGRILPAGFLGQRFFERQKIIKDPITSMTPANAAFCD